MSLGLCGECKRFARAGEPCPFCGSVTAIPTRRLRPHVTRAALVMVGALVTQCDCEPTPIAQPYGAPPNPPKLEEDSGPAPTLADAGVAPPKDKM
jgi:hypothetical protein